MSLVSALCRDRFESWVRSDAEAAQEEKTSSGCGRHPHRRRYLVLRMGLRLNESRVGWSCCCPPPHRNRSGGLLLHLRLSAGDWFEGALSMSPLSFLVRLAAGAGQTGFEVEQMPPDL